MSRVLSVLTYGAEIWGYSGETLTALTQNKAMRVFLGVNRNAPILSMIGDLEWVPQSISKTLCLLRFWNRLTKMENTRLTKYVFLHVLQSKIRWCKTIRNTFDDLSMTDIFYRRNHALLMFVNPN